MMVELSPAELLLAATTGVHRHVAAIRRGLPDRNGHDGLGWNLHIEGACGEMAVAKALNIFWNVTINTFKHGLDVGRYQVRTRSKMDYDLIIRPDDSPDDYFILVLGAAPKFDVAGWIRGEDARRNEWKHSYGGRPEAWFIPRNALKEIELLPGYHDGRG